MKTDKLATEKLLTINRSTVYINATMKLTLYQAFVRLNIYFSL